MVITKKGIQKMSKDRTKRAELILQKGKGAEDMNEEKKMSYVG